MQVHLFGASTPSGEAFRRLVDGALPSCKLHVYSRRPAELPPLASGSVTLPVDFSLPDAFQPAGEPGDPVYWVSFAPIWLLAPFLERMARQFPERLADLRGLIACSSSSVLTKRFAANRFDRELVRRLRGAEEHLLAISERLGFPCHILQPTLIYGQVGSYSDQNISRLTALMRRLPLLPLPADTGLRQPIHASQLAAVAIWLVRRLSDAAVAPAQSVLPTCPACLPLGGDVQLSYRAMLKALQQALPEADPARRCRLLPVPNQLFFWLASPLLLRSPKAFEAVLRMGADLAGFTAAHRLLGTPPQRFPVQPLP